MGETCIMLEQHVLGVEGKETAESDMLKDQERKENDADSILALDSTSS